MQSRALVVAMWSIDGTDAVAKIEEATERAKIFTAVLKVREQLPNNRSHTRHVQSPVDPS